jgi:peptidyl-prolyl cis-trans isomerase C
MSIQSRFGWALVVLGLAGGLAAAQDKGAAATVNGQPIAENAVQRALLGLPADKQAEARAKVIDFLIDNAVLDQHLQQLGIDVPKSEIDSRVQQIKDEIKKENQVFEKVLAKLLLTEEELRAQLGAELRWEKYCTSQAADKVLHEVFDKNPEMFDGTMVRARHIQLTPKQGDAKAAAGAKEQLVTFKKQIEEDAAKEVAKVPADADNLTREKVRTKTLEDSFAALARKESACSSKEQGGDLSWFPRCGSKVEAFASAAFALKPFQISDVVETPYGYHLILVTDRRPGKETKFDDVKDVVKEVYCDRLREMMCADLRPKATIVITPAVKP